MPGGPGAGHAGSAASALESLVRAAEKDDLLLYITAFCGVAMPGCVYVLYHYIHKIYSDYSKKRDEERVADERMRTAVTVFFASEGNEAERLAHLIADRLSRESPPVVDLTSVDVNDFEGFKGIGLFVVSSAKKGREPEGVEWFYDWLEDVAGQGRSRRRERGCRQMHFAVLGIDNSLHSRDRYNRAAKTLVRRLRAIGAKPLCGLALADKNRIEGLTRVILGVDEQADLWADRILEVLDEFSLPEQKSPSMRLFGLRTQSSADSDSSDSNREPSAFRRFFLGQGRGRYRRMTESDEEPSESEGYAARQWANSGTDVRHRGRLE